MPDNLTTFKNCPVCTMGFGQRRKRRCKRCDGRGIVECLNVTEIDPIEAQRRQRLADFLYARQQGGPNATSTKVERDRSSEPDE